MYVSIIYFINDLMLQLRVGELEGNKIKRAMTVCVASRPTFRHRKSHNLSNP